jgi:hypothetical protein
MAGQFAKAARAKKMIITHFSKRYLEGNTIPYLTHCMKELTKRKMATKQLMIYLKRRSLNVPTHLWKLPKSLKLTLFDKKIAETSMFYCRRVLMKSRITGCASSETKRNSFSLFSHNSTPRKSGLLLLLSFFSPSLL